MKQMKQKANENDRKLCVLVSDDKAKRHSKLRFIISLYHYFKRPKILPFWLQESQAMHVSFLMTCEGC